MFLNVLSSEIIRLWKHLVAPEVYAKMCVEMVQIRLRKKCLNFGTNEEIFVKIRYDTFNASSYVIQMFQARII